MSLIEIDISKRGAWPYHTYKNTASKKQIQYSTQTNEIIKSNIKNTHAH